MLAKFFGNRADFWMNLQLHWDMYFSQKEEEKSIQGIERYQKRIESGEDSLYRSAPSTISPTSEWSAVMKMMHRNWPAP
ncbi:MAG: hypothetical protein M1281_13445 [Chloroflexi bacterium]|nr:hypothetical protein [Chloroflexota bacterium]